MKAVVRNMVNESGCFFVFGKREWELFCAAENVWMLIWGGMRAAVRDGTLKLVVTYNWNRKEWRGEVKKGWRRRTEEWGWRGVLRMEAAGGEVRTSLAVCN